MHKRVYVDHYLQVLPLFALIRGFKNDNARRIYRQKTTDTLTNLTLHSKDILKIFLRLFLQLQDFCIWKLNEIKWCTARSSRKINFIQRGQCPFVF